MISKKRIGYTLIEVLIAVLIFGTMLILASFAFNQGIKHYEGISKRGLNFWENTKLLILQRSISSMTDYFVKDPGGFFYPYFFGQQDLVSYVSLSPVSKEVPVLVFLVKEKTPDGTFNLTYYELPVYTMTHQDLERLRIFKDYRQGVSVTIFSNLTELNFSFYGFDRRRRVDTWTVSFEGRSSLSLPKLIRIDFRTGEKRDTLYFGVFVDSRRKLFYNEHYL